MIVNELDPTLVKQAVVDYFHADITPERVTSGASTYVYRIRHNGICYYLRILPEDASYAAEAMAHTLLCENGVRVPQALYFEHQNKRLGKSILLTGEIPGRCVQDSDTSTMEVLYEAGAQLALINSIPTDGFGWINRREYHRLTGEKQSFADYYYDTLYSDIDALNAHGFAVGLLRDMMNKAFPLLEVTDAYLAHGDFDNTHIYHHKGQYTGIIDLGEIRGSHRLYDLAHYKLHSEYAHFEQLCKGYQSVYTLTEDDFLRIDYLALFVGLGRSRYAHYRHLLQRHINTSLIMRS